MKRRLFLLSSWLVGRMEAILVALTRLVVTARYQAFLRLRFEARAGDIFIMSYPKAGTTAMQMIVHNVLRSDVASFNHINDVIPWFEVGFLGDSTAYDRLPSPRVFKTHHKIGTLPKRASYIHVVRNPKDSCVSFYFHLMSTSRRAETLPAFVQRFVSGRLAAGSWYKHLEACRTTATTSRVLHVSFDDIALDLGSVVDRVSEFCERPLSAEHRALVLQRCSFGAMRLQDHKFDPRSVDGSRTPGTSPFVRRGTPNDWVNHLSPNDADLIDRHAARTLRRLRDSSADKLMRTSPRQIAARGTVRIPLYGGPTAEYLYASESEVVPSGLRILLGKHTLEVNDRILLAADSHSDTSEVRIPVEVKSVTGDVVEVALMESISDGDSLSR